ncbi:MAG: hypothetical protein BIFFINMI_04337 [Phycisphaerae bacterium]|nr:hypothetical protein [Phycisphaerae bacterium]
MGISIGLVGLGSFGSSFADLFMAHPLTGRVALCDREADRVAAFANKESWKRSGKFKPSDAYATLDDICKADLDALVIITQHWLHAPQCVQAMEAGKHVYCAVPLLSVPDADEILDWCDRAVRTTERTGRHFMYGETTFYRPEAMYCRRRAAEGAFGRFVYSEGEYFHAFDLPTSDLRKVWAHRMGSTIGKEFLARRADYGRRGIRGGPMHYPTHSTGGPISVTGAHAVKVSCRGFGPASRDEYFAVTQDAFSNETALFTMSDGSTMRICEYREIGFRGRETFRIYGTEGSFEDNVWHDKKSATELSVPEMRDKLPAEVEAAFRAARPEHDVYGGHGGSHAYLVHEFVDAIAHDRRPACDVYQGVRYMAAGAVAHKSALRDGEILDVPDWGDGR